MDLFNFKFFKPLIQFLSVYTIICAIILALLIKKNLLADMKKVEIEKVEKVTATVITKEFIDNSKNTPGVYDNNGVALCKNNYNLIVKYGQLTAAIDDYFSYHQLEPGDKLDVNLVTIMNEKKKILKKELKEIVNT
ncbi:hypothetical protein [Clostridium sp. ZS2-4]|uniref:hypothetical protein n=1 Tax=Clostridium sp. ZS2-4 TaxID=2987703 RepID=UPI00227C8225|nr:hypothetical protein [Clostridium sp. ZS2-4]MCY6355387.1 hypothetical protein [Clostridium sp. ZS2-4]